MNRIKRPEGLEWPQHQLRIGDIRAFYDVVHGREGAMVEVLAIREKGKAMKWFAEFGEG